MKAARHIILGAAVVAVASSASDAQFVATGDTAAVRALIGRLDLEKYKATVKGLTQFGDRRQGTDRNNAAVDWIEAQLKSYGCPTERVVYDYPAAGGGAGRGRGGADSSGGGRGGAGRGADSAGGGRGGAGGGRAGGRGATGDSAAGRGGGGRAGGGRGGAAAGPTFGNASGPGGSMMRGYRNRVGVNSDSTRQPDPKLRALNAQPTSPGKRQEVFCTKVGKTHPEEMYILGGHMDGHGWGEAANDDGSGTALVMELARVFSNPDVQTDRTIRFALWNNEETGTNGARAYIQQREALQGKESPAGSGKYPEPKWLAMIQHDMMMFDHGMPRPDGTINPEQRLEADVNVEFQGSSRHADAAMKLAFSFQSANEKFATDYPATVGQHMTNTDSGPFENIIPAISLRENERGAHIQAGWDPHWHQPTDVFSTFSDKDFRLGLNAAQTTLSAVGLLSGVKIVK